LSELDSEVTFTVYNFVL